jgi:hypothetical protein
MSSGIMSSLRKFLIGESGYAIGQLANANIYLGKPVLPCHVAAL